MPEAPKFKRILLKLSGESLAGKEKAGISPEILTYFAEEVKKTYELGVQIGIVIGGGNIFRGISSDAVHMDRTTADHMGMLATVINSLALKDILVSNGMPAHVLSAVRTDGLTEYYSIQKARKHLEENHIVIVAGGTGNPYFTTDTAAVLRAVEIEADAILKGTRVDGVYNADPEQVEDAFKFDELTYMEVVKKGLRVMDTTAITLSMENNLPIIVFNFDKADNLNKIVKGGSIGTIVRR
jgi:uridylate kinase